MVKRGDIHIVYEKNMAEWSSINAFNEMQSFFASQTQLPNVILAANDDFAGGSILALEMLSDKRDFVITGQDASLEACKNILAGKLSMTVYKPLKKLAHETAQLAVKLSRGIEITNITKSINNIMKEVPAILLEPVSVDKTNLKETVVADGFIKEDKL
jgi:D-xylose transport system substrate-binding protein